MEDQIDGLLTSKGKNHDYEFLGVDRGGVFEVWKVTEVNLWLLYKSVYD